MLRRGELGQRARCFFGSSTFSTPPDLMVRNLLISRTITAVDGVLIGVEHFTATGTCQDWPFLFSARRTLMVTGKGP